MLEPRRIIGEAFGILGFMTTTLTIGTRGSALALVQAHWVRDRLLDIRPNLSIIISVIQTIGDLSQASNTPLASFPDKGIFAKELEVALLADEIDIAVHSMKDMASQLPSGLHISAVPQREDARDALVGKPLSMLQRGERVGTGSVRRAALLRHHRPDLEIVDIRGNVDTRIRKLREGQFDSIVLAVAGLKRLGREEEIVEILDPRSFIPDPGQGALAIQTRIEDLFTNETVRPLNHADSLTTITAERAFLAEYGGGCQTPVGAWAIVQDHAIHLIAMAALDHSEPRYVHVNGPMENPIDVGRLAAEKLRYH
jgi:hydroxymethylbilane synthase